MSDSAVSSLLVNERLAIREQRNKSREKNRNERRVGLRSVPLSKEIDKYDDAEMTKICAALRCGRSGNLSVTQLRTLKHLLLHPQGVASFMKDKGALHGLIGELSGNRPIHQLEAAYICVNLGLGEEVHCLPVCRCAGPYLIQSIEGTNSYLQEASIWAIGNLAGASKKCAGVICAQGAVLQLIQLLSGPKVNLSLAAANALIQIIHSKMVLQEDELVELARLSSILLSNEPDFCTLLYLLSCFPVCENTLLDTNIVTRIIPILIRLVDSIEKSPKAFTALLRTVGNLTSGRGGLELFSQQESAELFKTLLKSPYEHLRKETAWICANLLCHENKHVRTAAEDNGLPQALEHFKRTLSQSRLSCNSLHTVSNIFM